MNANDGDLMSAAEACAALGISTATLYAYVSRGLLESRPGADHRSRVYLRQDVERLSQRKRAGRGAARGAAQSLDRGLPVMETRISLIRPDSPYYRGRSAVAMVRSGATLEGTARRTTAFAFALQQFFHVLPAVGATAVVRARPGFQQPTTDIGVQRGLADAQQAAGFPGGKEIGVHVNRLIHSIKIDQ